MKCQNCNKKDVDAVIMIGGIKLAVCSPKCMDELLVKLRNKKLERKK